MSRWSRFDPDTDRRLVRGLNEGNEDTLIALYDTYAERLYDYCVSLIGDSKIAADTVHDCLIDAGRRAPRMRDRMRLRAWLYGAARRRCLQRGRSGGLHWEWASGPYADALSDDGVNGHAPGGESGHDEDVEFGLPLDQRRELLEQTLSRLDFPEQEALLLALRHQVTGSDLAATLGVPGRRAASRVARARAQAEAAMSAELRMLSWQSAEAETDVAAAVGAGRAVEADRPAKPARPAGKV